VPRKKSSVSGIFLSHSSRDKEFVSRLASDLVNRGFPVWFDSWEMEMGDSLYSKIYEGIDSSSALILVMSKNAVKSDWVEKELHGALLKEEELKNRFLLPIKPEECKVPFSIRDRIYADFSTDYLMQLERLEKVLRARGADKIDVAFQKELVPLRISRGLYLDEISFQSRISALVPRIKAGNQIEVSQLVLYPEPEYGDARRLAARRINELDKSQNHTPEAEVDLRSTYESIRRLEDALLVGVAGIMNGLVKMNEWAFVELACHWYVRIIRSMLLFRIWRLQSELSGATEFGKDALADPVNYDTAARFFGIDDVICCDVWKPPSNEYYSFFVDADSEVGRWFQEHPQCPDLLRAFWSPTLMYKYAIPQMVYKSYTNPAPFGWDFADCKIGRH